jgi:hypothetical protein
MKEFGPVAHMEKKINACRILVGKTEGKKQLGRPMCRWEDNIKMDCTVLGGESMARFN